MNRTVAIFAAVGIALGGLGALVGHEAGVAFLDESESAPRAAAAPDEKVCGDFGIVLSDGECSAAGALRFVALYNLQGAAQFCKWKTANPGEWSRLKTYAGTGDATNVNVVTWLGGSIRNILEAYLVTGAPPFTIQPNTAPNVCKTPLAPPVVAGVTTGETDVTVTVTSP